MVAGSSPTLGAKFACRIIRTCDKVGIKTVAVHSTADSRAIHVQLANESICIGPLAALLSYLNSNKVLEAAQTTDAQAIHPGYGFLSDAFLSRSTLNTFVIVKYSFWR